MKQPTITMSDLRNSSAKTKACFDASEFDFETLPKLPQASLPDVFGEGLVLSNSETGSPAESDRDSKNSPRLVQHCGPDCMITQRIVDRLLARMLELENERSELLAANRSWAVQFQCMKDCYESQIKTLEDKLKSSQRVGDPLRHNNAPSRRVSEPSRRVNESSRKVCESFRRVSELPRRVSEPTRKSSTISETKQDSDSSSCASEEIQTLLRQAEVYKEEFREERKARVRAHAQIEALRRELKRERKSRANQPSLASPAEDDTSSVFS